MIEYVQARVRVNNFTMFTVLNLIKRVGTMSLLEMESTMQINCLFDLNVQNKPINSESNSSIGLLNLRASSLGRHESYGCWVKTILHDVIDLPRDSNGGYIWRGITPHKLMLNTRNFQWQKIASGCHINLITKYLSVLTLQQKPT